MALVRLPSHLSLSFFVKGPSMMVGGDRGVQAVGRIPRTAGAPRNAVGGAGCLGSNRELELLLPVIQRGCRPLL